MIVVIAPVAVAYVWIARLIVATTWLTAFVVLTAAAELARWLTPRGAAQMVVAPAPLGRSTQSGEPAPSMARRRLNGRFAYFSVFDGGGGGAGWGARATFPIPGGIGGGTGTPRREAGLRGHARPAPVTRARAASPRAGAPLRAARSVPGVPCRNLPAVACSQSLSICPSSVVVAEGSGSWSSTWEPRGRPPS